MKSLKSLEKSNMKSQDRNIFLACFLHCALETRWLGGSFLMVYRNNAGRLGSGFISVCLETRWLGQKSGFYVPDQYCTNERCWCCDDSSHLQRCWRSIQCHVNDILTHDVCLFVCKTATPLTLPRSWERILWVVHSNKRGFWFLVWYAATQLALQLQQERRHVCLFIYLFFLVVMPPHN